jgi:hypothetical protein
MKIPRGSLKDARACVNVMRRLEIIRFKIIITRTLTHIHDKRNMTKLVSVALYFSLS